MTLITPAYAQGTAAGGSDMLIQIFPFILIFAIFYFLIIRPQRKRVDEHRRMVESVRRGDTVVTSGGIVGKVTRVYDDGDEIQVEIAEGVRVRVVKATLSDVRSKTEPAPAAANAPKKDDA